MSVAILTDTNSGITVDEGNRRGIFVIPMPVIVDGREYSEGESITHAELYSFMRDKKDVTTSMPSPQALCDMWSKLLKDHDEVVYIPMSSKLSNSCGTAAAFAENYGGRVFVADSRRISVTLRECVLDGKSLADRGCSGAEIKSTLETDSHRAAIYVAVDSLEYLRKSGRVSYAAAAFANVLNIKPVLTIQGGKLEPYAKVRGIKKCMSVMIKAVADDLRTRFSYVPRERLAIGTAGTLENEDDARQWLESVEAAFPGIKVHYEPLSCSIACHVGMNALGIAISETEPR